MAAASVAHDKEKGVDGHAASAICSFEDFLSHSFDYLIVGGGTAGLVLAARLTENPNVHVGVLEAVQNRLGDMLVSVPALFTKLHGNQDYNWMLKTVPQVGQILSRLSTVTVAHRLAREGITIRSIHSLKATSLEAQVVLIMRLDVLK